MDHIIMKINPLTNMNILALELHVETSEWKIRTVPTIYLPRHIIVRVKETTLNEKLTFLKFIKIIFMAY